MPNMKSNIFRSLSPMGLDVSGDLATLGPQLGVPPVGRLTDAAEAFARLIRHFLERRDSRLIVSKGQDGPYIQILLEPDGSLYAEVASNTYLAEPDKLDIACEFDLLDSGWQLPGQTPVACVPQTDNFWRRWTPPVPIGDVTLAMLSVLVDVLRTEHLEELWIRYFTWTPST
jgi:hypothetical protein